MRIGIEVQRLFRPHKHGMDLVALRFLRTLQALDVVNEYFVFVRPGKDAACFTQTRNFHVIQLNALTYADWEQIQQILINLSFNALDVMPRGGVLEMDLCAEPTDAVLRVLDTGPGIVPHMLGELFQPFVTTKETGTGLGLVISRRIAEEHGGALTATIREAGGACFELRLPLWPARPE